MTLEILPINTNCDREIVEQLAAEYTEKYNNANFRLTSVTVNINPQFRKANIYIGYLDIGKVGKPDSEYANSGSCEKLINWPHFECSENIEEKWMDLTFPKAQMERAKMLADKLHLKFILNDYSEELRSYFENGKACIDRI